MQHEIPNISSAVTPNIRRMSPVNGLSRIVFSQPNSSNFDQFSASPTPLSMTSADSTTTAMIAVAYLSQLMSRHKDLMNRFCSCALQLKNTIHEVKTLQLENVNLRIANRELSHQISVLLKAAELQTAAAAVAAAAARSETQQLAGVGQSSSEKSTSMSPTSETVNETGRVSLPKSISVRSSDYLKLKSSGADDSSGSSSEAKPKPKRASSSKTHVLSPLSGSQKVRVGGGSKNDGPIELEVFNQGMFKTELCNKWQDTRNCPYGDHCQFAHGIKELRPVIRHPRYKTEVCRMVLSGDPCPYGHRCHFRHALTPEEKLLLSTDTEAADSSEAETADSTDTAPIV